MSVQRPLQLGLFEVPQVGAPGVPPLPEPLPDHAAPTLRISGRARRMSLQVMFDGSAELVVPAGTPARAVDDFLASQRAWLERARSEQLSRHGSVDRDMPDCIELNGVGETWSIDRQIRAGRSLRATLRPGNGPERFVLRLTGDESIDDVALRGAVRDALKRRARRMYSELLPPLAKVMRSRYRRLQVRDQKTCWGSFSSRGTLSMNYAAVFLEPALVRYLCVHELAHYHHMDHSPAFWAYVSRWVPDARAVDRELGSKLEVLPGWLWS